MRVALLLCPVLLVLSACGMKDECDRQRAETNAPPTLRPMRPEDLSDRDMRAIENSCYQFDMNGDIAGRRTCIQEKVKSAIAGQTREENSRILTQPADACAFPWNN